MVITDSRVEHPDTRAWLTRARKGDPEAFGALVQPLEARLLSQAVALCHDLSTAEDLVSETLIAAWKSLGSYNETCRFSTWLYAILLHRYQKHVRRMRVRPVPLSWLPLVDARKGLSAQDRLVCPRPAPDRDTALDELAHELKQAVGSLPRRHRDVILLRFFGDASLGEMASVLGCSVGTVKSRLHHALEKLRKMKLNLSTASWDTGT